MQIIEKKLEELVPYSNNPRNNKKAIDKVADSIKEFGFKVPIVIDKNNIIVTGHTRLEAAKKLELKTVPCIIADDLSETQIQAFRLVDNKVSEYSEWDIEKLQEEFKAIEAQFDLTQYGFEDVDIKKIEEDKENIKKLVEQDRQKQISTIEKETQNAKKNIKQGDMFQLGNHILMCGDSTNKEHIEKLIKGKDVKLLLTDPPYGVNIQEKKIQPLGSLGGAVISNGQVRSTPCYKPVENDEDTEVFKKCWNVIKDYSFNKIIWGGNYFLDFLPFSSNFIIWKKKPDNKERNCFADGECAYCSFKTQMNIFTYSPVKILDLWWAGITKYKGWKENEDDFNRMHPTQKPVKLSADILLEFTHHGDYVLDLFGGSGSSLIAAEKTYRKMLMIEYDEYYIQKIIDRWEALTGQKAVKITQESKENNSQNMD